MKHLFATLALLLSLATTPVHAAEEDPFTFDLNLGSVSAEPGQSVPIEIPFTMPAGYHLYKSKMGLTLSKGEGVRLDPLEFSPSTLIPDPLSGEMVDVFEGEGTIKTSLHLDPTLPRGERKITFLLLYQGCSQKICYRLMRREVTLTLQIQPKPKDEPSSSLSSPEHLKIQDHTLLIALLLSFLAGIGSALTPCVLPIIPITLAFIGVKKEGGHGGKNFLLSFFLVLSMALTYAVLGLLASLFGKSLGFLYQNFYFLIFGVVLYVALALSLLGLYELQLPLSLRNRMAKMGGQGIWGAISAGTTVGFLAAPCVGPLMASLLLYVAEQRNVLKGFSLLFSYGLGMGSFFLIIGTFFHQLSAKVHGGPFMVWIKRALALLLLIPAGYYASIASSHLKSKNPETQPTASMQKDIWQTDTQTAFTKAKTEKKLLLVDFFATWCLPCLELEATTFSDPDLKNFLSKNFVPFKVNCTEDTPQCQEMVDRFGIVGWPTLLILSPEGQVLEKIAGETISAKDLKARLEAKLH